MSDAAHGVSRAARTLAAALEPTIGQVYFAPEAHEAYTALGFGPSPASFDGLHMPDGAAYFTSRGSLLGQVAPTVVAATFAVFNPAAVVPAVTHGWSLTDALTIRTARREAGAAQLERIVGPILAPNDTTAVRTAADLLERAVAPLRPEGRSLFAGARDHFIDTTNPWERFFQLGDMLREYRGDAHIAAWIAAGIDATEMNLLSEQYMGIPARTYARTRAWSDEQFDAAVARLRARGWMNATGGLTDSGRAGRESIETATDLQVAPTVAALGSDLTDLIAILGPWGAAVKAGHGYPGGAADLWPNR